MRFVMVLSIVLAIAGCVGSGKKEYPDLDPIKSSTKIKPLWVANVGEKGVRQNRQLSVAITNERVYAATADGHLMALQLNDGKKVWANAIVDSISAGPVVHGDVLYVGTTEAHLFALDSGSGKIIWEGDVSSEVLANPVISDKLVFVQTIDGKITALEKATGKKVWSDSRTVPALTLRGTSSPIITTDRLIAGFADGKLVALEKDTGKRLWESVVGLPSGRTDLQRMVDIDGLIQISDDEVYAVTYQGRVSAIAVENGRTIWTRDMSSYTGVTMDENQLYLTDAKGQVWAIDRRSGATLWRQDSLQERDVTGPVIIGNTLVVADGAGFVHWLSKEDGSFVARDDLTEVYDWAFYDWGDENREELDFGVSASLEVVDDRLYVRNNMGALSVFQLSPPVN
ncbi:outer membrane protein assembly factor BamB [Kaarinaea lacus]